MKCHLKTMDLHLTLLSVHCNCYLRCLGSCGLQDSSFHLPPFSPGCLCKLKLTAQNLLVQLHASTLASRYLFSCAGVARVVKRHFHNIQAWNCGLMVLLFSSWISKNCSFAQVDFKNDVIFFLIYLEFSLNFFFNPLETTKKDIWKTNFRHLWWHALHATDIIL